MNSRSAVPARRRPTQAVIFAGGRGTRLGPMTATLPKPMIDINGKPFLEHLVEMLGGQGFERILLLLGYRAEVIEQHFEDGRRWGVRIEYSVTPVEDETGRRLRDAASRLDDCFLLMYCDNYWPMQMDRMWRRFVGVDAPAMVTVYRNADRYTTDCVRVDEDGYVTVYDKSRTTLGLQGVEIGYAIVIRPVLGLLSSENISFEAAVYPTLAARRELLAFVTEHRYYSIGSPQRLPLTQTFLARRPTVLLDRDGVLNTRPPQAHYVRSWDEFEWLPGAKEALRMLREAGYRAIVVSNQPGIARGAMTQAAVEDIHQRMKREAADAGGLIEAVYYCPHNWHDGCACRKPRPGLLFQAQRDHSLDLTTTPFIGDDERDAEAADAAGCPPVLLPPGGTLLDAVRELLAGTGDQRRTAVDHHPVSQERIHR